jgi:hypothetical protein
LYSEIGGFYYAQEIVFDASLSYSTQLGLLSELFRRSSFSSSLFVRGAKIPWKVKLGSHHLTLGFFSEGIYNAR